MILIVTTDSIATEQRRVRMASAKLVQFLVLTKAVTRLTMFASLLLQPVNTRERDHV